MKVQALALGTGYAESSSWSQLFLYHEEGFDSVQEAVIDIREALLELIKIEQTDARRSVESIKKSRGKDAEDIGRRYIQDMEDFLAATPEEALEPVMYEIIHGTFQDHGEFWEVMSDRGWSVGNAWTCKVMNTLPTVCIDNADIAVVECVTWDEDFRLFEELPHEDIKLLKD